MNERIKFVIRGYGFAGKKHAKALRTNPEADLVALIDPYTPTFEQALEPCFSTWEEFLASDIAADVVNVCTPNGLHTLHTREAIQAGYHVVCEKPFGMSPIECTQVYKQAEIANKHIFCVLQNRLSPPIVWLKKILTEGRLGKLYTINVQCYWNRDERYYQSGKWRGTLNLDGGPLYTQFSHFIDILYYLFGEIEPKCGSFSRLKHHDLIEFEDNGQILFGTKVGKTQGVLSYSIAVWEKNMESSLTVIGEKGSIKIDGQYMDKIGYCNIEHYTLEPLAPSPPPNEYGFFQGSAGNHTPVLQNVIDVLKRGAAPLAPASEGVASVKIIHSFCSFRPTQFE